MTTYLVTGANRGIGLELVRQLAQRPGATVLATSREPQAARELCAITPHVVPLDVANATSIEALAGHVGQRPLDVLINNAGVSGKAKSIAALDADELSRVFAVNAFAPMLVARALMPNLRAGRTKGIVSITSQLGSIANNTGGSTYAYRASKAALNQLNRSLAHELRGEGFTCIAVHPGWVRTDMGGQEAPLSVAESAASLIRIIDGMSPDQTGRFFNYDGGTLPW